MKKVLRFVKKKRLPSPSPVTRSPSLGSIVSCYEQQADASYFRSHPLHSAVYEEDLEKVKKIIGRTRYDVTLADSFGRTPLHIASSNGNVAVLWQLLHARAGDVPLHRVDGKGATPLHRAVDGGHAEAAEMLLERGCPLDVSDEAGNTVLHLAVRRDAQDLTSRLLRKGASPDLLNRKGETPLLEALRLGRVHLAQNLLRSGASPHTSREVDGITPLMLACKIPDAEFAEILLDYDANPEEVNNTGKSAIDFAKEVEMNDLVQTLERAVYLKKNAPSESEDNSFDDGTVDGDLLDEHEYSNTQVEIPGPSSTKAQNQSPTQQSSNNVKETIENLSSWSSSTASPISAAAKARTVMDLSKMLPESPVESKPPPVRAFTTRVTIGSPPSSSKVVPSAVDFDSEEDNSQNIYDVPDDVKAKEEESSRWSSSNDSHKNSEGGFRSPENAKGDSLPAENYSPQDRRKSFPTLSKLKNATKTSATFTSVDHASPSKLNTFSTMHSLKNTYSLGGEKPVPKEPVPRRDPATLSEDCWDSEEDEAQLSLDVSSLKSQVDKEKEKKLAFKEELHRTREDQEKLSDENEELREEVSRVQMDNKELKRELVDVTMDIRHKEESIKALEMKIQELTQEEVNKNKEISELKQEIDKLLEQLKKMESIQEEEESRSRSVLNKVHNQLGDKDLKISSLENEVNRLKLENDKIENLSVLIRKKESVLENQNFQHDNLQRDHKSLREEYERLKEELSQKESQLKSQASKYSVQIQALESRLYERETELQAITEEKDRLLLDKERTETRLRKEIEMLQFQNESFDKECKRRMLQIEEESGKGRVLEKETAKKIRQLEEDNEALFQEKNNLLMKHKFKENEKDNLVQEVSVLKAALEQERQNIEDLRQNEQERRHHVQELLKRIEERETQNSNLIEDNKKLSNQLLTDNAEIRRASTKDLEKNIRRLEAINSNLTQEIDSLKSILRQRDEEIHELLITVELNSNLLMDERHLNNKNNNYVHSQVSPPSSSVVENRPLSNKNDVKSNSVKDVELSNLKKQFNSQLIDISSLRNEVQQREKRLDNVMLDLEHSVEKLSSANSHILELKNDISRIQSQYNNAINDKNDILAQLKNNEVQFDESNRTSVAEYRYQITKEKAKVEEKQDKCLHLLNDNSRLEKEIEKLQKELCELQTDLDKAFHERRSLQHRMMQASNKALTLEDELKHERRRRSVNIRKLTEMEHRVEEEKKMSSTYQEKMKEIQSELEKELEARSELEERLRHLSVEKSEVWDTSTAELKSKVRSLQVKNDELNKRVLCDGKKIMTLNETIKKSKDLRIQNEQKDQLIQDLQEKVTSTHQKEALKYQKELKKMRMKFEIMARNELNQKLSEVNAFLDKRYQEQTEVDQKKDFLMENIQNDLSSRLLDARKELGDIKNQMKATERGIIVLQRQLQERELELSSERSLRRKLEKQVERGSTTMDRNIQPIGLPYYSQPAYF